MQGSTGQGNQNGQKQGGLSWTQSPNSSGSVASNINANSTGGAKPVSQVGTSALPNKTPANNSSAQQKQMPANSSMNNKNNAPRQGSGARTTGIFIAGVIVGLIIGWGWFSLDRDNAPVATTDGTGTMTSSSSETATMPAGSNASGSAAQTGQGSGTASSGTTASGSSALSIAAQASGLQVAVSSVGVSVPTWVVIFDGVNGQPGNALGAKLFFPTDNTGNVELLRATVAGHTYFAGEYVDNGDHQFSKQTDSQVNTVAGTRMLVQFSTR
jgi:hypothetical protein